MLELETALGASHLFNPSSLRPSLSHVIEFVGILRLVYVKVVKIEETEVNIQK